MMPLPMGLKSDIHFNLMHVFHFDIKKRAVARFLQHHDDLSELRSGSLRPLYLLVTIHICHRLQFCFLLQLNL